MKDYIVVKGISDVHIGNLVKQKLNEGYVLQGGISVALDGFRHLIYAQAMVKGASHE